MSTVTIYCSKDSYVDESMPNNNYGTDTLLDTDGDTGNHEQPLLEFDISSIPAGSIINSCTLYTYWSTHMTYNVEYSRITGSWVETSVTWNTKPAYTAVNRVTKQLSTAGGWQYVSITGILQDAIDSENTELGIHINMLGTSGSDIYSHEYSGGSRAAYILINYTEVEITDYYVRASGGSDSNSGASWANAWATVHKGMTEIQSNKTLHIGFGTYSNEPANNQQSPDVDNVTVIFETADTGGGSGSAIVEVN